jgi:hypothetical protein
MSGIRREKMSSRLSKFGAAIFLLVYFCVPGTAKASAITAQQVAADFALVEADIAHNKLGFMKSSIAEADLTAGVLAMLKGDADAVMKNSTGAAAEFAIAIKDFNAIMNILGDGSGDPPPTAPEPESVLLVGLGTLVLAAARWMKNYQERRQAAA